MQTATIDMAPQSHRPSGRGARSTPHVAGLATRGADPLRYASAYHTPVLAVEVAEGLVTDREGLYIDGTLGGGGHSAALLDALEPNGRVIGIDKDAEAIAASEERLADAVEAGRFRTIQGNFAEMEDLLHDADAEAVDGILLDLGVSSHQIDEAARGFAFSADGPLDMRMDAATGDSASETAAALIARLDVQAITDLLRAYGEEPRAWPIANAIVEHGPFTTTGELAEVVRSTVPAKVEVKTLARVFQAFRIAVNGEMGALESTLEAALTILRPGGRLAVISYHSLEDRRAKHYLRFGNLAGEAKKDFYGNLLTPWNLLTRKPIVATAEEIRANPRSRSARLRISEKKLDLQTSHPRQREP